MPWIVVLGASSWTRGSQGFKAGVHEVDVETAEAAKAAGIRSLMVFDEEPRIAVGHEDGKPLSADDIRGGTKFGVRLEEPEPAEPEPEPDPREQYDFACPHCEDFSAPSGPSLARHVEFHH